MLPVTWFYLSSLMILVIFFKFNRFWSVRNFDLLGVIFFTPGLLFLSMHQNLSGYLCLFGMGLIFLIRLLFDQVMVRRPLLEPNLTPDALGFAAFTLLIFMLANVMVNRGDQIDSVRTVRLEQILYLRSELADESPPSLHDAGYLPFLHYCAMTEKAMAPHPSLARKLVVSQKLGTPIESDVSEAVFDAVTAEETDRPILEDPEALFPEDLEISGEEADDVLEMDSSEDLPDPPLSIWKDAFALFGIIFGQASMVGGLIAIGFLHFGKIRTGISAATLYALLPYTNLMTGRLDHIIPGMLIIWAVVSYRRPIVSGLLVALAGGLVFYPLFLIPIWCSFYWKRGIVRFLVGAGFALAVMALLLAFSPEAYGPYATQLWRMLGSGTFFSGPPGGLWEFISPIYRIPILVGFLVLVVLMLFWPSQKHLASLISCSALVLLAVQFWMPHEGGLNLGWYLPLLILTIFRPNLEDRVALTTVSEHWEAHGRN